MEHDPREALRKSRRHIAALKAENKSLRRERQMIAYEIHDGLAQHLSAALMHLQAFDQLKSSSPDKASREYAAATAGFEECHAEARQLISGLRPVILDELGIVAAIENLVEEANGGEGPKIEFYSRVDFARLPPPLENAIYRIAQESLNNARRHSRSDRVRIELLQKGPVLRLEIQDWGTGFDLGKIKNGRFGLAGIRERARMLGGTATIESGIDRGTRSRWKYPLRRSDYCRGRNQ